MTEKQLKNSILQWAIQGKLVPQDPNDEPASVLLERIREEKKHLIKEGKIKKDKNETIIYRGEDNSHYEKFLATGEVKCIDDEIPFEIPQGWEWCRLGSIGDWGAGATPAKGVSAYYGGNILWLRTGELNNGVVYDTEIKITEKALRECSLRKNKIGDVLIAMYGATIGKVAIAGKEMTTNQACCACTPFGIFNYYLFYFLMGSQTDFIKKGEGGAQPNISREKLVAHLMPVPPLKEQHRIVEQIRQLLPLVEKYSSNQMAQDKLNAEIKEKLKKSILQEAIQGRLVPQIESEGTAQELLEQIRQEKIRLVKEGKLKKSALTDSIIYKGDDNRYYEQIGTTISDITEEIPFELPKSWMWSRLGIIAELHIGKTPPRGEQRYWSDGTYNWVAISDMVEGGFISKTKEKITEIAVNEIFKREISPSGSLLMSFKLTVGKTSILETEAYHNEAIITISPFRDDNYILRNYLFHILPLISNYGDSKDAIKGKTLNSKSLNDLLIPLPPLAEQARILEKLEVVYHKVSK